MRGIRFFIQLLYLTPKSFLSTTQPGVNQLLKKNITLYLLRLTALLLAISLLSACQKSGYDWEETLELESKEPYGIDVFEKLIEKYATTDREQKFIIVEGELDEIFTGEERDANFLLIGQAFLFKEKEINALLEFVANGNTAMFSSKSIPYDFLQAAMPEPCYFFGLEDHEYIDVYDTIVHVDFERRELMHSGDGYPLFYAWRNESRLNYSWTHINPNLLCDSIVSPIQLGYISDKVNFVKIYYGDGEIYLHTTPMAFTNFHLRNEESLEYAEKVLAYLRPGDILWDKSHHISELISRRRNNRHSNPSGGGGEFKETPLKYILSQPPLAWAWYTLVGMALLYLIFRAKRRQRVIPVLEPITNTSLEFIDTIGRLYFQKGNPRQLILQKMKYLQNFVKSRYGLNAQEWDEKFITRLSQKSNVPKDLLERIALMHKNVNSSRFSSDNTLISFHEMMEDFFRLKK